MANKSLNRITLMGNLTRDPELKYTPQGTAVCSFGLATNRSWTTATGESKEEVQFHRVVAWQKLAELCAQLLAKGRRVYLEGRIVYRSFEGKDGVQRQVTEIVLSDFILFDGRRKTEPQEESTEKIQTVDEPIGDPSIDPSKISLEEELSTDKKSGSSKKEDGKKSGSKDKKKTEETTKDKQKDGDEDDDIPF